MKKLTGEKALAVANRFRITIHQYVQSPLDFIRSIELDRQTILDTLLIPELPVIPFMVQETDDYFYINYVIYHPFDWSDKNIPNILGLKDFIDKKDSHRHDTESLCMRVNRVTDVIDMVTVSHYSHIFAWDTIPEVICDSQSHALRPKDWESLDDEKYHLTYRPYSYSLSNIAEWNSEYLDNIKSEFRKHEVDWIDEQYDHVMKLQVNQGIYKRFEHKPGDIVNNPENLFEIGKELNR